MTPRWLAAASAICFASAAGCSGDRATDADCATIADRIVALELEDRGFHDPALAARKGHELSTLLQPELARCRGMRLPVGAMACVAGARTTDEISEECLR